MGGATILCVEDDPLVREVTQMALEHAGYEVRQAANGREAVDTLSSSGKEISLVLLDWIMPGMDGQEVVEEMQRLRPGLKILLTSGYAHVGALPLITGKQVTGFLQKPYLPSQLLRKVRQALVGEHRTAGASG